MTDAAVEDVLTLRRVIEKRDAELANLKADLLAMARATIAVREDFGGWWLSSPDSDPLGQLRIAFDSPGVQAVLAELRS